MNGQQPLSSEEYIEQAYFFRSLFERLAENLPTQDLLRIVREEILATTKLPLAIDFMLTELKHAGAFGTAMRKLSHYFTAFQSYVISEAENERGRFDLRVALQILQREAEYRSGEFTPQGLFLYQFEALCRNRLGYHDGLDAMAADPAYDAHWRSWILSVRRQVGIIDVADLIYVESEYYGVIQSRRGKAPDRPDGRELVEDPILSDSQSDPEDSASSMELKPQARRPLFGEREGRVALANRRKDPLLLFASFHRQLGYPEVPRPQPASQREELLPQLARRMERLEMRLKLFEEEHREGIDLSKFYQPPQE